MKTITIGAIVTGKAEYHPGTCVYRVRDGDLIFYVGKTIYTAADRIREHIGLQGRGGPSALGNLITDNWPEAKAWEVDILTLEDCRPFVLKHFPYFADRLDAIMENWQVMGGLELAEQAVIYESGPCLNVIHNTNNPNTKPLPDKYIKHKIANEGVRLE